MILHVYSKADGDIEFYEDDGTTYNYEEGNYSLRKITYTDGCLNMSKSTGGYHSGIKVLKVVFHGIRPENISLNGVDCHIDTIHNRFVEPIKSIDSFSTPKGEDMKEENLSCLVLNYVADEIILKW